MKLLSLLLLAGACTALELTKATWDEAVKGKTVFVKFQAPWCGHCKSMKPAWDKLMGEFKDHKTILVADVDCDGTGKSLCDAQNVEGFPTIKHGSADALEDYDGGREFEALMEFASTNLKPSCSPTALENCSAEDKAALEKFLALGKDELQKQYDALEDKVDAVEKEFEEEVDKLQKRYEELESTKKTKTDLLEKEGLKLMKKAVSHKGGTLKERAQEGAPDGGEPPEDEEGEGEEGEMPDLGEDGEDWDGSWGSGEEDQMLKMESENVMHEANADAAEGEYNGENKKEL